MNKIWWMILLFAAMVLAQWWVPVSMITGSNRILEEGTPMKFRCAPVDPNDPFRGKFIVLNFDIARYLTDTTFHFETNEPVYLELGTDGLGFAKIEHVGRMPPAKQKVYLKTSITYINQSGFLDDFNNDSSKVEVDFDIPFRRFYLEESKAPMAEDLYRTGISDTTGNTYGLVYLLNGEARIKDVIIRDTSILERLNRFKK